mmetsp:Transcript_40510/g.130244  ORF Transcript_40510/g.130244 Transcript_40510/m.130244 type:complete len:311 (-) Transcript_40510:110-1042(-)
MVTVHELYSTELADFAGPNLSCLSRGDAEVALPLLQAGTRSHSRNSQKGRPFALPERPLLGPSAEVVSFSKSELDDKYAAVQDERERVCDRLRLALERRAASRLSSTMLGRTDSSREERHLPRQRQLRRASSRAGVLSPSGSDFVPAVFPFPVPIPHGPPRREFPSRGPSVLGPSSTRCPSSLAPSESIGPPQTSLKEACAEDTFVIENKRQANAWIEDCKPKFGFFRPERPYFMRMKLQEERRRNKYAWMYNHISVMPFEQWCEMKKMEEMEDSASLQQKISSGIGTKLQSSARGKEAFAIAVGRCSGI